MTHPFLANDPVDLTGSFSPFSASFCHIYHSIVIMKQPLFFFSLICISMLIAACGDSLPTGNVIEPDAIGLSDDGPRGELEIAIRVAACDGAEPSRQYALLVYHPNNSIFEYYAQENYDVRWYVDDHILISNEIWLECLGVGTFTVEITDTQSNAFGSKVIEL